MTEQEFSQRLKTFRKAKNLTQQELADHLGVSNKSVSRWESAGGFPDVMLLCPLARALDVTVDDLLSDTPPVRKMGTAEWQGLLSFAFAVGGGVLFFLLDLFMPSLVCYLLFLGALAYGTLLQQRYAHHSRWFFPCALTMDFFVNCQLLFPLLMSNAFASILFSQEPLVQPPLQLSALTGLTGPFLSGLLLCALLSAALTGGTWLLLRRRFCPGPPLRLQRASMTLRKAVPLALLALLQLFFLPYTTPPSSRGYLAAPLPGFCYRFQLPLFWGLALLAALICVLLFRRRGQRGTLALSLATITAAAVVLPSLSGYLYYTAQGNLIPFSRGSAVPVSIFSRAQLTAALLLSAAYLLLCCFRLAPHHLPEDPPTL